MVNEHKVDQPEKEEIACSCLVETRLTTVPNKAIPYQNKTTHLDPIRCLEGTGPSLGAEDWRDGERALTKTAARPPGREQNKQKTKEHWTPTSSFERGGEGCQTCQSKHQSLQSLG